MLVCNIEKELNKSILKVTALIMLEAEEQDENSGYIDAWEYISTYFCGDNDYKSCFNFLRGETQVLARLGALQIWVGKQGSRELLYLLCNNDSYE